MRIVQSQMSRRSILSTLVIGAPAMGVLGALNLAGATPAAASPSGADFLQMAESKTGCPFIWGEAGPSSFDCSGLVQWSLSQLRISFPRVSGEQINACLSAGLEEARATPGAIMYMPGHIGISCGDGTYCEARNYGYPVGIYNNDPGWTDGGLVPGLDYSGAPSDTGSSGGVASDGSLVVDGYWGSATTQKLQETLGLTADGLVPGQPESWKKQNPGLTTGWQWVSDSQAMGADVISKLQAKVGAAADG